MNWKRAPGLNEYLLMYPLMPLKLTKELYSENIFLWCNILPLGESAVTLMLTKTLLEFGCNDYRLQILRLLFVRPYERATLRSNVCVSRLPHRCRIANDQCNALLLWPVFVSVQGSSGSRGGARGAPLPSRLDRPPPPPTPLIWRSGSATVRWLLIL